MSTARWGIHFAVRGSSFGKPSAGDRLRLPPEGRAPQERPSYFAGITSAALELEARFRARLRTTSCSRTARCASSMTASVRGVAAASELAIEIRPNRRRPITHGRSSGSKSAHSIGSFKVS